MGLLGAGVLAAVATSCYSPDTRDCIRACNYDTDCISDQVCTTDHFCASPALGPCTELVQDARIDARKHHDAAIDAPPDTWPTVTLTIHIDGSGSVALTGGPACNTTDCMFQVLKSVPVTATAVGHGDHLFDHWTSTTCMNQPAVCAFTPTAATQIAAKFK